MTQERMSQTIPPLPEVSPAGCPMAPPVEFASMRRGSPIAKVRLGDGTQTWLVTRYSDVVAVLADRRFSANPALPGYPTYGTTGLAGPSYLRMMLRRDPPDHTRLRRLVAKDFMPKQIDVLKPRIRELVDSLLDDMERTGPPVDFVDAFAGQLPTRVICWLLGAEYDDHEVFERCVNTVVSRESSFAESAAAQIELDEYMRALAESKKSRPDEGIMAKIARYEQEGLLSSDEVASYGSQLIIAGFDTTAGMLSLSVVTLLSAPGELERLKENPELWGPAIEELLRLHTVARAGPRRVALEDVEIAGQVIQAGEGVIASVWSANHDEQRFENADRFVVASEPQRHLAFGWGIHLCLGQSLARAELGLALPELFRRFPKIKLEKAVEDLDYREGSQIFGLDSLPISW